MGRYLAAALRGRDALDTAGCLAALDAVIYGNHSIKSAFDIALHDLAGQYAGLPIWRLLGGTASKPLHTDMTVSLGPVEK